ncbi:hypothetical protein O181_060708, partial [Austropuccinia psidii MF-1]|nr:hypothetical protein [Austropuccinia psidii MF-1]
MGRHGGCAKYLVVLFVTLILLPETSSTNSEASTSNLKVLGTSSSSILNKRNGIFDNDYYDVAASPQGPLPRRTHGDAPWTQAKSSYQSKIGCPLGLKYMRNGIVLLVPGTGGSAREIYESSPYYQGLPAHRFDLCWVDLPNHSMSDMQLSAEFIAYAIQFLAPKSRGGKINIISFSQGGSDVQWAASFWPSIRSLVTGFVAIAPPMKGTLSTYLICPISKLFGGCFPSVLQQTAGSHFMEVATTLRDTSSPAYALLPTTIIYSLNDEVVTPQFGPNASSRLIGASNIGIQEICGAWHVLDHFFTVADIGVYGVALDALVNGRPATPSTIDRSYCTRTAESLGFQIGNLGNDLKQAFRTVIGAQRGDMIRFQLRNLLIPAEPYLQ